MTIKCYYQLAHLISLLSSLYFLKYPNLHKKPHNLLHFTILSQQCPCVILEIVFLSAVSPLEIVSLWFPHAAFPHVVCWLFLDIKCLWVSLMCPIRILLSLTQCCILLLWHLEYFAGRCCVPYQGRNRLFELLFLSSNMSEIFIFSFVCIESDNFKDIFRLYE